MNDNYISPWHIFVKFEGKPQAMNPSINPEIYYS